MPAEIKAAVRALREVAVGMIIQMHDMYVTPLSRWRGPPCAHRLGVGPLRDLLRLGNRLSISDEMRRSYSRPRTASRRTASSGVLGVIYPAGEFAALGEPEKIIVLDAARFNEAVRNTFK